MGNARPFWTSKFQELSIDIKNAPRRGGLTLQIVFWVFQKSQRTPSLHFWEWELHYPTLPKVGLRHGKSWDNPCSKPHSPYEHMRDVRPHRAHATCEMSQCCKARGGWICLEARHTRSGHNRCCHAACPGCVEWSKCDRATSPASTILPHGCPPP